MHRVCIAYVESISTHASLAGRDEIGCSFAKSASEFQPTRPLRDATRNVPPISGTTIDFNPRVPCGTRRGTSRQSPEPQSISTHASLAGRDHAVRQKITSFRISTHASLAGRDYSIGTAMMRGLAFQPTRPLRDATLRYKYVLAMTAISTHASLAGRDAAYQVYQDEGDNFNPRVPCGTRPDG